MMFSFSWVLITEGVFVLKIVRFGVCVGSFGIVREWAEETAADTVLACIVQGLGGGRGKWKGCGGLLTTNR